MIVVPCTRTVQKSNGLLVPLFIDAVEIRASSLLRGSHLLRRFTTLAEEVTYDERVNAKGVGRG
eukprot:434954-Pleurochrysis_carterae.AAC.1